MKSGIYKIECAKNKKCYIGSASNIKARWASHKFLLKKGKHHSIHLQRAWIKHGENAFVFSIIEKSPSHLLIEREQAWLDFIKPFGDNGYNIAPKAGKTEGVKRTIEQIEKTASFHRGRKLTNEHKAKINPLGRKHSEETKEKIRQARLKNNGQKGKALTDKQKEALHRSGDKHPWYGRSHTCESKRKISLSNSYEVLQLDDFGSVIKKWETAKDAAQYLGLRCSDSIYRSINSTNRKAAGFHWRRVTDRAVIA